MFTNAFLQNFPLGPFTQQVVMSYRGSTTILFQSCIYIGLGAWEEKKN